MVDVDLKSDLQSPGWNTPEDSPLFSNNEGRWRFASQSHTWRPPTDVFETADAYVVRVEIAGMQDKDFSISLSDRLLAIRGIRPDVTVRRAYHQMEIFFGEFLSEVELPGPVVSEKTEAEYREGFLWMILPKVQPHKVQVTD
jgi:HSP20 family protein